MTHDQLVMRSHLEVELIEEAIRESITHYEAHLDDDSYAEIHLTLEECQSKVDTLYVILGRVTL